MATGSTANQPSARQGAGRDKKRRNESGSQDLSHGHRHSAGSRTALGDPVRASRASLLPARSRRRCRRLRTRAKHRARRRVRKAWRNTRDRVGTGRLPPVLGHTRRRPVRQRRTGGYPAGLPRRASVRLPVLADNAGIGMDRAGGGGRAGRRPAARPVPCGGEAHVLGPALKGDAGRDLALVLSGEFGARGAGRHELLAVEPPGAGDGVELNMGADDALRGSGRTLPSGMPRHSCRRAAAFLGRLAFLDGRSGIRTQLRRRSPARHLGTGGSSDVLGSAGLVAQAGHGEQGQSWGRTPGQVMLQRPSLTGPKGPPTPADFIPRGSVRSKPPGPALLPPLR